MAIESESNIDYLSLARKLEKPVREAGQAILDIYHQGSTVQIKGDGSPVTEADLASETIYCLQYQLPHHLFKLSLRKMLPVMDLQLLTAFFWLTR